MPVAVLTAADATEALARAAERGYLNSAELLADLQELGVELEVVGPADVLRAAELIVQSRELGLGKGWGISLADSLRLAVAERLQLPVIGGDKAWDELSLKVEHRLFRR